jgi:uncharacterized phiE125 gp8 family phage protein
MWLETVSGPSAEPLTATDAQRQVRRFDGDEIPILTDLIAEARQRVEDITNRQLITATYRLHLDGFYGRIVLPKPPLVVGSVVITYTDTAGATQTLATNQYVVTAPNGPKAERGVIEPAYEVIWPTALGQSNVVTVAFTAGYGADGSFVPRSLMRAMKLLIGHWFQNGSGVEVGTIASEVPIGVKSLIAPYIVRETC